jgi:5-methylcytosine-specific restriction enzyme subunit McrC
MSIPLLLQEWEQASPATNKLLAGVRLQLADETQAIVQNLSEAGKLKITELAKGVAVEATSYVGRIGIGDLRITIRPKIETTALLHLLQYTYGLRQLSLFPIAHYESGAYSFQDILISQLAAEVSELVTRGLRRTYVRREEALLSPRGRIAVQTIANQGGIFRPSLPCIHYPRLEDSLINQVLLQGVLLGARLANDDMLKTNLQLLAHFHLSGISPISLNRQTLKQLHREMNRLVFALSRDCVRQAKSSFWITFASSSAGAEPSAATLRLTSTMIVAPFCGR